MPFPLSISDARIVSSNLVAKYRDESGRVVPLTLNLDSCLGAANGKFQWGGTRGVSAARNPTVVNGSVLQGYLQHNGQSRLAQIDLSTNIEVRNRQLVYNPQGSPQVSTTQQTPQTSAPASRGNTPPPTPPPVYTKNDEYSYRSYLKRQNISFNSVTSSEQYSSSYLEFSVGTTMRLEGSFLCAEARKSGEEVHTTSLRLDLDSCIGVVNGKFIWGRTGFYSKCEQLRIEKFYLCATINGTADTLDLRRYLQVIGGKFVAKVGYTASGDEMGSLLSEALVTEHDSIGAIEAIKTREGKSVFESTFDELATKTSEYVAEEAKETFESAEAYLTSALFDDVKTEITTILHKGNEKMASDAKEALEKATTALTEAQTALTKAQEAIVLTENALTQTSGSTADIETLDALFGPLRAQIIQLCNERTEQYLKEVRVSAITHFRQRAEIMMEREIIAASIRRAQPRPTCSRCFCQALFPKHSRMVDIS